MNSIEYRTNGEWEALARDVVASSGVPDADSAPLEMALKNSSATEEALQDQFWVDLVNQSSEIPPIGTDSESE